MVEPFIFLLGATQGFGLVCLAIEPVLGMWILPRDGIFVVEQIPDLVTVNGDLLRELENRAALSKRLRRTLHLEVSRLSYHRWLKLLVVPLALLLGQDLVHALICVVCKAIVCQQHVVALIVYLIL